MTSFHAKHLPGDCLRRANESQVFIRPMEIKEDGFLHSAFYGSARPRRLLFIRCLGKRSAHYSCHETGTRRHPHTLERRSLPLACHPTTSILVKICKFLNSPPDKSDSRVFKRNSTLTGRLENQLGVAGVTAGGSRAQGVWQRLTRRRRPANGLSSRVPRRRLTCAPNPPVSNPCRSPLHTQRQTPQ